MYASVLNDRINTTMNVWLCWECWNKNFFLNGPNLSIIREFRFSKYYTKFINVSNSRAESWILIDYDMALDDPFHLNYLNYGNIIHLHV